MITIEYFEQTVLATLEEARSTYDALHERVQKLLALLVSGAGAAGVYALGKLGPPVEWLQVLPLAALSCWWFGIAAVLLRRGAMSLELPAGSTRATFAATFKRHFDGSEGEEDAEGKALLATRWSQLAAVDRQIDSYCRGGTARATALDGAYKALTWSPAVALVAIGIAVRVP